MKSLPKCGAAETYPVPYCSIKGQEKCLLIKYFIGFSGSLQQKDWKRPFHLPGLGQGCFSLETAGALAGDQAALLRPQSTFIPVEAPTDWETTSLPLLVLPLPLSPLPWKLADGSDCRASRKAVFVIKGQSSQTSIYISKHEQFFLSLRNQFPQRISQSCFSGLN